MLNRLSKLIRYFKAPTFTTASLCQTGGRETNEDRLAWQTVNQDSGYWVVADGLGGHHFGEMAAGIVIKTVSEEYSAHSEITTGNIRYLLNQSDLRILNKQQIIPGGENMASTAVLLMMDNRRAIWGHIGDSRLYRFRNGQCKCLTSDHTMAQLLVNTGQINAKQIHSYPERNNLLQSLGGKVFRMNIAKAEKFKIGDVFLLCSDGFWEYLSEEEMLIYLQADIPIEKWLLQLEQQLLKNVPKQYQQANNDNYTALAVRVE
ncbi:PP2C family protein-serine/threonine phosphatase [Methylobacter psychrophilus]|uniref:PP2C family protein-serine/threonine phosphatase n=1 Tax=Methylobacter psychrophilus TaxID=96941 RepID=UPI0021D4C08B|nr:PP2C family serine/threonine-protein phosphatase [Methylobacter psychrophilus]